MPAGIYDYEGEFIKGDVVEVYGPSGFLGRGETMYSSEELDNALGKRTDEHNVRCQSKSSTVTNGYKHIIYIKGGF